MVGYTTDKQQEQKDKQQPPSSLADLSFPDLDDFPSLSNFVDFDFDFDPVMGSVLDFQNGAKVESLEGLSIQETDAAAPVSVAEKVDLGGLVEDQMEEKVSLDGGVKYDVEVSGLGEEDVVMNVDSGDKPVVASEGVQESKIESEIGQDKPVSGTELEESKVDGENKGGVEIGELEIGKGSKVDGEENKGDVGGGGVGSGSDEDESESDSESDSESESSSSSSSSSSSDDDDEVAEKKGKKKVARVEGGTDVEEGEIMMSDEEEDMVAWGEDEDDVDAMTGPIKSKNEIKDLPPVPPVTAVLEPHHQTLPIGSVLSIMGAQVVVEGVEKHNPLCEGSILWITESRVPLGIVDEIFGPVKNPYYIVRHNTESEVPSGIEQGTSISFVPEFANHVLNDKSLYQKGYDASGENDEELSDELEFSDDEKEAEYKRMLKLKKRVKNDSRMKPGTKRYEKNENFKNQKANRSKNETISAQTPPRGENKFAPPVSTPLNQGNSSGSSNMGQGPGTNRPMVPPFPFNAPGPNFGPPNGMWGQPQGMAFPGGMPANPMPWMPPNQLFQGPLPMGMMPQQQMTPMPGFPSNFNSMSGLSNFGGAQPFVPGAQPFAPWPMGVDPNMLTQMQYGMGLQAQPNTLPVNAGQQETPPNNGQQMSQNNFEASQSGGFNRGRGGGRRGGFRGRGGRGRN